MRKTMLGTGKSQASKKMAAFRRATRFEFSAGGIARDGDRLLMIHVRNLEGREMWTFPKGHLEAGETAAQAALREVEEETGYRCEIIAPLEKVAYWFERDAVITKKTVTWFVMKALEKTGVHDPKEILEARWVALDEAKQLIRYKSDKKILGRLTG
jgi:8-oxo-dGTP pyrophosphatase MutT (NUDIX family)